MPFCPVTGEGSPHAAYPVSPPRGGCAAKGFLADPFPLFRLPILRSSRAGLAAPAAGAVPDYALLPRQVPI
jgi:hypothetical protein